MLQAFLVSTGVVTLAEIGDKTQLLSLILAARYRKPLPIVLGVLTATLVNHAAAGGLGNWLSETLSPAVLNWAVVASFALMAGWVLVPDRLDPSKVAESKIPLGIYGTTTLGFFIAEMGDKTQIATIALAAAYSNLAAVVAGTTCGMLLANAPVAFLGKAFSERLPLKAIHYVTSILFLVLGAVFISRAARHLL